MTGGARPADTSTDPAPGPDGSAAAPSGTPPVPGLGPSADGSSAPDLPAAGAPAAGRPTPNPDTVAAVQTALGAEYAAVWTFSLITAFLGASLQAAAQQDLNAHRARRDATIRLLTDYGVPPEPAEPSYRTPAPVDDSDSAQKLAVSAEDDAAAAWRSVLERCDDSGLRGMAVDRLTDSVVRGAHWSARLGTRPVVAALPGQATSA